MTAPAPPIRVLPEIRQAVAAGRPVVALESSVLVQGLPIPSNRDAGGRMDSAVREAGAIPAFTAVVRGTPTIGLERDELERFLGCEGVHKVSARDLAWAMARGLDGATTVAASLALAVRADIPVFATGGIGGVHREPPGNDDLGAVRDESADLVELSRCSVLVVCAGAKSILDLPATLERLESLGVPIVGYRTSELPGFYTAQTGLPLAATVDDVVEVTRLWRAHRALGRPGALVVVQSPPHEHALSRSLVEKAVADALRLARDASVQGGAVTPFLLSAVQRITEGRSLTANLALLEANARLAGEIAAAIARD